MKLVLLLVLWYQKYIHYIPSLSNNLASKYEANVY